MSLPVVKKTFSLRPGLRSWLSQFGNKSEIINKALEEYVFRHASLQEYSIDALRENMEEYKRKVGYVSQDEQQEIQNVLDAISDDDNEIAHTDVFTL